MQSLWGMIRALQMITLSGLINVKIPIHLHIFMEVSVIFAGMDVFSGEDYYEEMFEFKETDAIGEKWAFFGMDNSNFVMNSGSYFVIIGGMFLYMVIFSTVNRVCVVFAKNKWARKLGMLVYVENYWEDFVDGTLKLFLESYFDLVICTGLNLTAFYRTSNLEDLKQFFVTKDDVICSTITILHACLVLFFPIYTF